MPRLFSALSISEVLTHRLAHCEAPLHGARWVEPDDYHITLCFMGDVSYALANDFAEALSEIHASPFSLKLSILSHFGHEKPRSLIARVEDNPALTALQKAHEKAARRCGFAPEARKFTPHITLARLKGTSQFELAQYLSEKGGLLNLEEEVQSFHLYSANDSRGGGPYIRDVSYPFTNAQQPQTNKEYYENFASS